MGKPLGANLDGILEMLRCPHCRLDIEDTAISRNTKIVWSHSKQRHPMRLVKGALVTHLFASRQRDLALSCKRPRLKVNRAKPRSKHEPVGVQAMNVNDAVRRFILEF